MSGQATMNVVDDEEMSSQGSVNAPVAPQPPVVQQGPMAMEPTEVVGTPVGWHPTMTQQSGGSEDGVAVRLLPSQCSLRR